jgi:small subunit ribosomal protein S6
MREYEMTVVFDLALTEADGPDASVELLTTLVEGRGGTVLKVDHWGRRRLAYPIKAMIDAEYVVTRLELEPEQLRQIEAALGINERVLRYLAVRADELPPPPAPREERSEPAASPAGVAEAPAAPAAAEAPASEDAPAAEAEEAPAAEAQEAPATEAAEAPDADAEPAPAAEDAAEEKSES